MEKTTERCTTAVQWWRYSTWPSSSLWLSSWSTSSSVSLSLHFNKKVNRNIRDANWTKTRQALSSYVLYIYIYPPIYTIPLQLQEGHLRRPYTRITKFERFHRFPLNGRQILFMQTQLPRLQKQNTTIRLKVFFTVPLMIVELRYWHSL